MKASQESNDPEEMRLSLRLNWQLWTIIQAELLDPQCPLENAIRGNMLSLAQYVDKHTANALTYPTAAALDTLISINRELAGGLFTTPGAGSSADGSSSMKGEDRAARAAEPAGAGADADASDGSRHVRLRIST